MKRSMKDSVKVATYFKVACIIQLLISFARSFSLACGQLKNQT